MKQGTQIWCSGTTQRARVGREVGEGFRMGLYMYIVENYSAIKRNTFESVLMRWMNLEPIMQSEVSQKEKDKYRSVYVWNLERW